jgi:putative membrane protein
MGLLLGTVALRPYVFGFLAAFLLAGGRDLGARRTLVFGACVWPIAWLAEASSTRTGIPFGLYHYTGVTRGRELYVADVPFFDSLSFVFLAYAAFCLARWTLRGRTPSRVALAVLSGALMMALDVVIDPLAVRGGRWFLGEIFFYPRGGVYFGVPLSNFAGWLLVGAAGVGAYLAVTGPHEEGRPAGGMGLYYAVLAFNLALTAWIGEWLLAVIGVGVHLVIGLSLTALSGRTRLAVRPRARGLQGA